MGVASITANVDIANMALQRLGQPAISTLTEVSRDATVANNLFSQNRDYCLMLADWDCLAQRAVLTRSGKVAMSAATAANPVHVTATGHVFIANELVFVESVTGMTQLNGNTYRVYAIGTNSLTLYDLDGTTADGSGFTAWVSGGYVYRSPGANFAYAYDLPSDCIKVLKVLDANFAEDTQYTWRKERNFIYTDVVNAGVEYIKQITDPTLYEPDLVEVIVSRLAWFVGMRIHSDKTLRDRTYQEMQAAVARAKMTNSAGRQDQGEPEELWADVR